MTTNSAAVVEKAGQPANRRYRAGCSLGTRAMCIGYLVRSYSMRVVASGLTGREVTAAMPVTIYCPNLLCCRLLQAPDQSRGDLVACEACGATFLVPFRPLPPPPDHTCEDEPTEEARAEEMSLTFAFDADSDEDARGHEVVHFPLDRRSLLSSG